MTINTVRARLTLWYVTALGAVLLLFSIGVYVLFSKTLQNRLDNQLRSAAQVTQLALNHEIEEHEGQVPGEKSVRDVLQTMHQTSFPNTAISVWDGARLVAEKTGLRGLGTTDLSPQVRSSTGFQTLRPGGKEYRFLATEVFVSYIGRGYQIIVNESAESTEIELASLRQSLLFSVPLFIFLSAAGGYLLARKSLHPVSDIAETMQRISSANLDERLTIDNPGDEFGKLGDAFNRLLDRLSQAFGQQRRFMADASHELRTPLSVAITASQFTLQKPDRTAGELREALEIVQEQLRRLRRIVEDMFVLAQADAGAYQPALSPVYVADLADEALRAARVLANSKGIMVSNNRPDDDLETEADEGLLRQLMLILLDNAIKYTPSGGSVEFNVASSPDGLTLEVRDTGVGIPEADQPFIFERFFRSDKARSRRDPGVGSGAGLGLAIAKWIAEVHGGSISGSSSPTGTIFRVWLPHRPAQIVQA